MQNEFSQKNLKNKRIESAIAVGAELFLEKGIENVKMTDIADASGVGVATLYRYFGTKTGIAIACVTYLWEDIKELFGGVFESEAFVSQTGLKQLKDLMRMFQVLYTAHKDFMRLLGEFDRFIVHENVPREELREYERSVINFYPILERAFKQGCEDGSVRKDIDFRLFYLTYAHALTELCKKFIYGEVLPSDDFSNAEKELEMLIETGTYYLSSPDGVIPPPALLVARN